MKLNNLALLFQPGKKICFVSFSFILVNLIDDYVKLTNIYFYVLFYCFFLFTGKYKKNDILNYCALKNVIFSLPFLHSFELEL